MEYFADIFAAQYIGEASNYYLNYVAHKYPPSITHPATDSRIEMVNKFLLDDKTITEIVELKKITFSKTKLNLEVRHDKIILNDFHSLIPSEIKNEKENSTGYPCQP